MSVRHSEHFDLDLRTADVRTRNSSIGEIINLARDHGATVTHRPRGWRTVVNGEQRYWYNDQVNLFVDYLADAIRDAMVIQ